MPNQQTVTKLPAKDTKLENLEAFKGISNLYKDMVKAYNELIGLLHGNNASEKQSVSAF